MEYSVRGLLYGIGGLASGFYSIYLFFKYKKMAFNEIKDLPESSKKRIVKLRVEKYGWLAFFLGIGCIIVGTFSLFDAFW